MSVNVYFLKFDDLAKLKELLPLLMLTPKPRMPRASVWVRAIIRSRT